MWRRRRAGGPEEKEAAWGLGETVMCRLYRRETWGTGAQADWQAGGLHESLERAANQPTNENTYG